jgi:hypothetical protein
MVICCKEHKWVCRLDQLTRCKIHVICEKHDEVITGIKIRRAKHHPVAFRQEDLPREGDKK